MKPENSLPLFREEALANATQPNFLSRVILSTPVSLWASTLTLFGFTAVGIGFAAIAQFPQIAELPGEIERQSKDPGSVSAQLLVDSNTVDRLHPGQEVQLKYEAFPFQTYGVFTGKVQAVSDRPIEAPASQTGESVPMYPVRVELAQQQISVAGTPKPLRSGMTLTANVVLERKTLLNWLLEPMLQGD
jgi:multidrug efflux pump subunit AcrA (membrane-fusion protein)